jgi:hypothetical protein
LSWRRRLATLLALLALAGPVWAGVVEDAQESLQQVPSDNPEHRPLDGTAGGSSSYTSGALDSGSAVSTSAASTSAGSVSGQRGHGSSMGGTAHGVFPPDPIPAAQQEAQRERQAREKADNTLSLAGILVLLALVAAAGLYSRRAGTDD